MGVSIVSICMITYAHEKYILEAIEGVLKQNTDFDYELIIANDSSPDNTDSIVLNFLENHPDKDKVRYFKHEKNIGMMPNFIFAVNQCRGKYIALCEGDDYWTDPFKLQKQIDFLEKNKDFSICAHAVQVKNETDISSEKFSKLKPKNITTINYLIKRNFFHTVSVVFRNNFDKFSLPQWMETAYPGDWPLHILNAQFGKIRYFDSPMAVYRISHVGVHSTKPIQDILIKSIPTFENLRDYFKGKNEYKLLDRKVSELRIILDYESNVKIRPLYRSWKMFKYAISNLQFRYLIISFLTLFSPDVVDGTGIKNYLRRILTK